MAAIGVLITIVVVAAALVTVAMVVAVIVASVSTTAAVRQEEWLRTLKRPAPSKLANFVRAILGVYVRRMDSGPDEHRPEEERPPWYLRSGPTRR
jgi:type II secretory pathway component PulK